jgi:Zn-dependent oligopeptidase
MKRTRIGLSAALLLAACSGPQKTTETPVDQTNGNTTGDATGTGTGTGTGTSGTPDKSTVQPQIAEKAFAARCGEGLAAAKAVLPKLLAVSGPRTVENTLEPYNDIMIGIGRSAAMASLMSEVHPDEKIRDAARSCEQDVSAFATDLQLNRPLYDALAAVDLKGVDADTSRFVTLQLRDFRRAGVDKDDPTRERLKAIEDELTKLGQQFAKNIAEDVRSIEVDSADRLKGMPEDFIQAHPPGKDGKIHISTDYPDYNPFMAYADDDGLRKELYIKFRTRADKENTQILQQVLTLRAEKAKTLGYKNWADYITEDKMIKSGAKAAEFIERINKIADKRAKKDYAELLGRLKKIDPKATAVSDWQKTYLENKVKTESYAFDPQAVRPYLEYSRVLGGLLDITSQIYDIQYVEAKGAEVWHQDVVAYDVVRGDQKLGRIYLDMHPRDGKFKHAAQFTLLDGVTDRQLPEGVLVCNFPNPRTTEGPALMEHDDVVTMFHEFGHLMHHVLGGKHHWIRQSGVATEWDFVEAPSQMFEEWAWSHDTLARFAKHYQTGEVIPADMVQKMRKADKFALGTATKQQVFYAALSLSYHQADPAKLDQLAELKRLQKKYTPFAYVEGTTFQNSFGHLIGYSAIYYTYQWSLVIAKDLLTPFEKAGLMNTGVTYKYRDTILVPGGSKDAADLVKDFLGRPYNFKAYEKYLGG